MASFVYNRFKYDLMKKTMDLSSDTIKVALMGSGHSTSTMFDNVWADVSANELAMGSGYTTGGATMAGKAVTQGTYTKWTASDTQWTSATFTAYYAVIYDTTATDNLICSIDLGGPMTVLAGTFKLQWNVNGIITML